MSKRRLRLSAMAVRTEVMPSDGEYPCNATGSASWYRAIISSVKLCGQGTLGLPNE